MKQVWEVPVGAEVIAFSDKTRVEMFSIGDHILGIQGHPECTKDILNNLIDRLLSNDSIEKGFAEDVKSKLQLAEFQECMYDHIKPNQTNYVSLSCEIGYMNHVSPFYYVDNYVHIFLFSLTCIPLFFCLQNKNSNMLI
ncbi:Gamma-glutamyl peptidase 5 [Camellia lanceoleosa]|uniref:Gamma-glutamyl peptidase 5 n=1 Tax=Camellia lanceoleosa TaxID=1840588 RepID=A0ACC0G4P7_9ERIC|nr:Gamma-glutamyl peptidase 5 [Camellia lanceoleosa]